MSNVTEPIELRCYSPATTGGEAATSIEADAIDLKNQYFLITRGAGPVEWHPPHWAEPMPRDCIYFGQAFLHMEKQSQVTGLRVYITYDWNNLPEYGESVVVLLLGEEIGRVPRYIRHVRAVFKTMRMRPYLGIRKWKLDALRFGMLMKAIRDWPHYWKSIYAAEHTPRDWPHRVREERTCLDVPLGYLNFESLPQKPMQDRAFHCFFAGQRVAPKKTGWMGLLPLPKNESRAGMFAALRKLQQSKIGFRFDGASNDSDADNAETGLARNGWRSYSQRMMDTKFCLAPRGNVVDTFRFFEGMRSGCVVVCEPLPPERFYAGAPVIQIDDWSELAGKLAPFLGGDQESYEALDGMRRKTLDWWEQQCSESAIGREMAQFVDTYRKAE